MLKPGGVAPAELMRLGLIALAVLGILAAVFELATERHWTGLEQRIPWLALAVLAAAAAALVVVGGD